MRTVSARSLATAIARPVTVATTGVACASVCLECLTKGVSLSSLPAAPAAARERRGGGELLLPLRPVQLLHQGQAQPHPARALHEASAQRESAQAAAAAEGPSGGGRRPGPDLYHPQVPLH